MRAARVSEFVSTTMTQIVVLVVILVLRKRRPLHVAGLLLPPRLTLHCCPFDLPRQDDQPPDLPRLDDQPPCQMQHIGRHSRRVVFAFSALGIPVNKSDFLIERLEISVQ